VIARLPGVVLVLLALTAAGGALRVAAAASPDPRQSADERAYAGLARGVALHGHYAHPNMADPVHWPPGAPLLFAAALHVAPGDQAASRGDVPAAYPVQALLATALIPAVGVLALLTGGPVPAGAAAAAVAFYPPLAASPRDLLSEPLGALGVTAAALALVLGLRRSSRAWLAAAGAVLGLTVLTRADLLLLPLVAAGVVVLVRARAGAGRGRAAADAAVVLAACAACVLPWTVFASGVAGRPVPVSSGGSSNLFVGTYLPGNGTMLGLKRDLADEVARRDPRLRGVAPARLPQERVLDAVVDRRPGLDQEAALRAEALANLRRYALGDPLAFAAMAARKVGRLWLDYTVGSFRVRSGWITALHLVLLGAAAAGLALGLARRPRDPVLLLAGLRRAHGHRGERGPGLRGTPRPHGPAAPLRRGRCGLGVRACLRIVPLKPGRAATRAPTAGIPARRARSAAAPWPPRSRPLGPTPPAAPPSRRPDQALGARRDRGTRPGSRVRSRSRTPASPVRPACGHGPRTARHTPDPSREDGRRASARDGGDRPGRHGRRAG